MLCSRQLLDLIFRHKCFIDELRRENDNLLQTQDVWQIT